MKGMWSAGFRELLNTARRETMLLTRNAKGKSSVRRSSIEQITMKLVVSVFSPTSKHATINRPISMNWTKTSSRISHFLLPACKPKVILFISILKVIRLKIIREKLKLSYGAYSIHMYCFSVSDEQLKNEIERGIATASISSTSIPQRTYGFAL